MGSVLVPKGPRRVDARPESPAAPEPKPFDKQALIDQLFALPLPPSPTRTRTYPTHTVLGRIMRLRQLTVVEVSKIPGGPSARQLGDHLAGRRNLNPEHMRAICRVLRIDQRLMMS